ncbi:MAG: DUF4136 domain-containing protein [Bacteroidota bacterium]
MKRFLAILLIGGLAACSSVKVSNTASAPNADFTKYKTFDFYKLTASGDTVSKGFDERVAVLKSAISAELGKRGYTQTSSSPDLLLNIGIQVDEKTQTRQTDWRTDGRYTYIGQRNYSWKSEEIVTGYYKEGTVTVHVVDAVKNSMVWKGTVKDILPSKASKINEVATAAMKSLFEKYPVPAK